MHRPRLRATNGLERAPCGSNQELERRPRVARTFRNRASLLRLVTALALEQGEEWVSGRRYLDMAPFWEDRRCPAAQASVALAADSQRVRAWRTFAELSGHDPLLPYHHVHW